MDRKNYSLSPSQQMDARRALRLLKGTGLTLEDVARVAVGGSRAGGVMDLERAVEGFLDAKADDPTLRPATFSFYRGHLFAAVEQLGEKAVGEVTKQEWKRVIGGSKARRRAVRALLGWCEGQDPPVATAAVLKGIATGRDSYSEPEVPTVEQCRHVMAYGAELSAALALTMFAGLRMGELGGSRGKPPLRWKSIDVSAELIRVPPENAKTGKPRVMEGLPSNLWQWLRLYRGAPGDRVCPMNPDSLARRIRGLDPRWPQNGGRHAFATYHLAAFENVSRTTVLLGHEGSPSLLYRHYRGLCTKEQAFDFFSIEP